MAPKKSKPAASASQHPSAVQRPTKSSGRKREHSDTSSVSDMPESIHQSASDAGSSNAPVKRRRKAKTTANRDAEVIMEEDEMNDVPTMGAHAVEAPTTGGASADDHIVGAVEDDVETSVTHNKSPHVHFGADQESNDRSTATHSTPFHKMSVKRRFTLSPNPAGDSKRYRTTTHRTSLPPNLSQEDSDPVTIVQEIEFAPLRAVLDERIRRRLRHGHSNQQQDAVEEEGIGETDYQQIRWKEERIRELVNELDSHRQAGLDGSLDTPPQMIKDKQQELAELRHEVAESKVGHYFGDVKDDSMMVLSSQGETVYPQLRDPATPTAVNSRATDKTQFGTLAVTDSTHLTAATSSKHWDAERRRYEESILALSQEANDAKTKLQILEIELSSLGPSDEGLSGTAVVQTIRASFDRIREALHLVLPDSVSPGASHEEVLDRLLTSVTDFASRLRVQDTELEEQSDLVFELRAQIDGLLERLAASEIRQARLETQWKELDEGWDAKEREIGILREELDAADNEGIDLQQEYDITHEKLRVSLEETGNLQQSVHRLRNSLQDYREQEENLTKLITRMETEHSDSIAKMNQEREQTVREVEDRLDAETSLRHEKEKQADERQNAVTELETRLEELTIERDALFEQLESSKASLNAALDGLEQAESAAQQKDIQVDDLEARVTVLEEELETLNATLVDLRSLNDAERNQREAAEAELDERDATIDGLNDKLHHMGIEANSLRQKMFEVQQQNAVKVTELEQAASERDEQYQADIAREVERRDAAEDAFRTRDTTILELQTSLESVEHQMQFVLEERNTRVAELEAKVDHQNSEIARLREDLNTTENLLQTETVENQDRRGELEASIAALKDTVTDYEITITDLQRAAAGEVASHNSEMDDRNAAIAELNHNVAILQGRILDLETEKTGLERRVESEAEQMLQLQADKEDELEELKEVIRDKQTKILVVEEKAKEADQRWQDLLDERNHEIETLRVSNDTRVQVIVELNRKFDDMKARFINYVHSSQGRMRNARDAAATAEHTIRGEQDALSEDGRNELVALERLGEEIVVGKSTVTVHEHVTKKTRGRPKKRNYDSGLGVASDDVDRETIPA